MNKLHSENYFHYLLFSILIIFAFQLRVTMPSFGLDPSWIQSLCFATKSHLTWGKDIIFTYGPWHMVASRAYDPQFYYILLFSQLYIFLVFWWFFLPNYRNKLLYIFLIICACLYFVIDTIFFAIGLIFFLKGLSENIRDKIILCLFLLLSGFVTLAKMSYLPLYLGLTLLADAYQIIKYRKFPLFTACLVISFISFWLLSGHQLADLPIFLQSIKPIISGYSEAMQITKSANIFYILSIINLILVLKILYNLLKDKVFGEFNSSFSSRLGSLIIFIAIIFYEFLTIKSASTRLDSGHGVIGFAASLFAIAFLLSYKAPTLNISTKYFLTKNQFAATIIILVNMSMIAAINAPDPLFFSARFLLTPEKLNNKYKATWQELEDATRIKLGSIKAEDIKGNVDTYSADITALLALKLNYSPRPIIQTYSSYDPELQIKDLEHLQGENAPQSIFINIEDIDGRFPTNAIGPSLLEILKNYRLKEKTGLGLLLERRKIPLSANISNKNEVFVEDVFHIPVIMPENNNRTIRMMSVDLNLTFLGKILKAIAKAPEIHMDVINDNNIYSSRLIPPAAKTGFIISPLINNTDNAILLFNNLQNNIALNNGTANEIRLRIKPKFSWVYQKNATIKWWDVQF